MYSSGNLYHNSFTPLPLGGSALDASSNTTTPVSVVAPAQHATQHLPRDSTTHIVNENLRSQVRVLEDEVRVLRRAVAEPLGGVRADQAAAAAAVSSSSSPPAQSSDFYYTSAAAIAARRRAQIEELRRRTQILSEAKGNATTPAHREVQNGLGGSGTSRQARIPSARKLRPSSAGASSSSARRTHSTTATTSTPGSSRPRGRFVSPVEIVMVPTSSRTTSRYKKRAQTEAREEDTDEEDESETVRGNRAQTSRRGKPEMAFGHRVVPSTARPTHALTARTTANAAAPWKQPDGDIPIQGIGRGASLMPSPTASRHHHDVHMSPHDHTARSDVERTRRDMNDEDDESERQAILRAVLGDLYQSTAVATVHGGGSQSAACAATSAIRPNEPAQGHPYLALLPTASTAQSGGYVNASIPVVPPILSTPEGPSTTAGDSTTAALEADVALLTRTVDVLRRTLIDRDAFLQRLAESMHLSAKRPSSSSTSSAAAAVAHTRTSPSSIDDAPDVTVRALAEELQRVRDVLLHTQQQLVLTEQQFTRNQVALTRRNEELVALRAHLQSNPNNAPAHNTDSSAQQSQPAGGSGGTASMGGLVWPLSASVRTLDSNLGPCSSQNIATTTTAAAAGASEVNPLGMSPRGELAADANPSRPSSDNTAYYTTTAWSSTVGTPSLVPLPLTSLPPPIPVPQPSLPSGAAAAITHEHLAQTLPPPSAPPLSAFPPSVPAPPTETTTMTTVAELQNKLAVMTRKVQAWESWYAKQQQEKRERVDVDEPAVLARTASRSVCDARSEPLYYSAYTIDSLSARASPAAVRSHATQGLPDAMRCCDRCAMLSRAEGEAAPPPHNVCTSRRDPKECAESPAALLSQTNWDLRQDVREAVARERVLREIAMKERQVAEERLAQATQWREAHEKEGGSGAIANGSSSSHNSDDRMKDAQKSTPPPPPQPQETVD